MTVQTPPNDVRMKLKAATQTVHERLHQQAHLLAIQDGRINLKDYQQVISSFLATFIYVQQACNSTRRQGLTHLPHLVDVDKHIDLLQKDLHYCQSCSSNEERYKAPTNLPRALAKFATQAMWHHAQQGTVSAWLMGHYYCLHGSRFGRHTLAKGTAHLFQHEQVIVDPPSEIANLGRQYFTLKPTAEPCSWPAFCDLLDKTITTPSAQSACQDGASLAFKLLETLLNLETHAKSHVLDLPFISNPV